MSSAWISAFGARGALFSSHPKPPQLRSKSGGVKSASWQYEDEYRLIAEEEIGAFQRETMKTRDSFYQLPKDCLKSVIVGARASASDRAKIGKLVAAVRPEVLVRQANCSPDRYELTIDPAISFSKSAP
jgi:hypothetical protein